MSVKTNIEWCDSSWNPVRGCSRVSPGCQNCYAERVAARFAWAGDRFANEAKDQPGPFHGFATQSPHRWTGKVALVEDHLLDPLRWRKPRRIFVNSMSDLFHESLPDEAIDRVFAVMALAPRHTFQILTKRAGRMRAYFAERRHLAVWNAVYNYAHWAGERTQGTTDYVAYLAGKGDEPWPLPNVWLGVSCEDQQRADERIPLLLQTPATVRFVSAEPLLGAIDFAWVGRRQTNAGEPAPPQYTVLNALDGRKSWSGHKGPWVSAGPDSVGPRLDWIIVGGESGPGARPCDLAWIRSIVKQTRDAGVACFVKQLGSNHTDYPWPDGTPKLCDRKGGDPAEWPEGLRVREFPE